MAGTAARSTNTFPEWLLKQLQEIPNGKVMPDADVEWIIDNMETPLLMKLREPQQQMYMNGQSNVPGAGQGGQGGAPAGMMAPGGVPDPTQQMPAGPQVDPRILAALSQGQSPGGAPGMPPPAQTRANPSVPGAGMDELSRMMAG